MFEREKERRARMILSGIKGIGPIRMQKVMEASGGCLAESLEVGEERLREMGWGPKAEKVRQWRESVDWEWLWERLEKDGAEYLLREDEDYPITLKWLNDAPMGMYLKHRGKREELNRPGIGIVGTRHATAYGRMVTRRFVEAFVQRGYRIISGLALGIDAEAHRAAMQAGGVTAAVIGSGLDICYPRENRGLMEEVVSSGGVWTEFPYGRRADRQTFPQRNRIVAGMSEALLVVESGANGGSLITARFAAEQGKSVYVIPGRIDSEASVGCHELIRDGATLVMSPQQVLEDLEHMPLPLKEGIAEMETFRKRDWERLPEGSKKVDELIRERGPLFMDQIADFLEMRMGELQPLLMTLEIEGVIQRGLDGRFEVL